ncbi:MAG: PQQ-dependent sugar dehydrogenase [Bacteroidota bacterium]
MNTFFVRILLVGVLLHFIVDYAYTAQLPLGFAEEKVADGLDPTRMTVAPDGRIFIAEKNGRILIVKNGELLPDPFLIVSVDNYNERGLSGIALDPDFDTNHHFYVFYTVPGGNFNRISRFTANGDYAIPNSEEIILDLEPLSGTIHNGGAMAFGADGKLYVAVGDGANAENSQNLFSILGKVLRINKDGSIPFDNPFYDQLTGIYRAIWAYGFRNPFTFDIQPGTGRFFLNDVGGEFWEEVNDIIGGKNYGWNEVEGYLAGQNPPADYQDPLHAYPHDPDCAVMGAAFYNPASPQFPTEYVGKYFFADYCSGWIKTLDPETGEIIEVFATDIDRPIAIQTAPDGSLYYIERGGMGGGSEVDNTSSDNGTLYRIYYTGSGAPFISEHPEDILLPIGEDANFSVSVGGAPTLSYQWIKDGLGIIGENGPTLTYSNVSLDDDGSVFQCAIANGEGSILSEPAILSVTENTRPIPTILTPLTNLTYQAGDTLFFSGTATDAEDGALSLDQYFWRIDFHHEDHTHPAMSTISGIDAGSFIIPTIGETSTDVWYRVHLTVEDSEGLLKNTFVDVYPELVDITIKSEPTGLLVFVDGKNVNTPFTFQSVIGIQRSAQASQTIVDAESFFVFENWEGNFTEPVISYQAPEAPVEYTVYYEEKPLGTGTGLLGQYRSAPTPDFVTPLLINQVDPIIDFNWGGGSPDPDILGEDNFHIRWTGEVQPLFSEAYTFYVVSDDGIRLWVDNQLIIDQWVPQPPTETQGEITLQGGERYSIKLEYFEEGGGAVVQLWWSSLRHPKQIIPTTQLYPDDSLLVAEPTIGASVDLMPQPADEEVNLVLRTRSQDEGTLRLYDSSGRLVRTEAFSITQPGKVIPLDVSELAAGVYVLEIAGRLIQETIKVSVY